MIVSPLSASPVMLSQATQIQAPSENVAQFQSLMMGIGKSLSKGGTSLIDKEGIVEWGGSDLMEDTAIRVSLAEKAIDRLGSDIQIKSQEMRQGHYIGGNLPQAIIQQKLISSFYFLGLNRIGNSAQDFTEEVQSVSKGR